MKKQKGFVSFSGLIFFAMLILCGYLVVKAIPLYYENYQIQKVLDSIVNDKTDNYNLAQRPAIFKTIVKRFQVNHITMVKTTDIEIGSQAGKLALSIEYNATTKLFGNLYFIAHFKNKAVRN